MCHRIASQTVVSSTCTSSRHQQLLGEVHLEDPTSISDVIQDDSSGFQGSLAQVVRQHLLVYIRKVSSFYTGLAVGQGEELLDNSPQVLVHLLVCDGTDEPGVKSLA